MTTTFTNGTITTSATEQTLFDITADKNYATWIFANAMTSTDTVEIKVYVKDQQGNAMRVYTTQTLTGTQTDPAYFVPFVPTKQYKVTIKRTLGTTDKVYNWMRIEIT